MDRKFFISLPMDVRREILALQVDNHVCHKAIDDFCEQHQSRVSEPIAVHWTIKQLLNLGSLEALGGGK